MAFLSALMFLMVQMVELKDHYLELMMVVLNGNNKEKK
jgi:hypothetical protein